LREEIGVRGYKMTAPTLGGQLWRMIRYHRLTVAEAARMAGMTRQQLWRILNGDVPNPGILTVQQIVRSIGGRMKDLFADGDLAAGGGKPPRPREIPLRGGSPLSTEDVAAPERALPHGGHPITIDVTPHLQAIAYPEADGRYSVVVPALPGCVSEAASLEEAQANAIEAAEAWLTAMHDRRACECGR
jgi:predicted RNase H-like HicB family nuclease/transcriptional regulator with XRE-family HTH domain